MPTFSHFTKNTNESHDLLGYWIDLTKFLHDVARLLALLTCSSALQYFNLNASLLNERDATNLATKLVVMATSLILSEKANHIDHLQSNTC